MTESDVRGNLMALRGALEEDDDETAVEAGLALLENFLVTQVRIAEALDAIKDWGIGQSRAQ